MPSLTEVVILCLACWRLSHLVQYERGPLAVFARIRHLAAVHHDADGEPLSWPDTELGRLVCCLWCGSVWVGAGLVGLYLYAPNVAIILSLPLALSAAAIVIQEVTDGKG
jgi:hypothetical protein